MGILTKSPGEARSVKWLEGLRGLASLSVVLTHLARAFDYDLFSPADSEHAAPRILQWPFIRLLWQGRIGVALFALLTGYVCALKPLRLVRDGERHLALAAVGKSTLRRPFRLVLPATVALLLQWTLAQFHAFDVAHSTDSLYLRSSSVRTGPTLAAEGWHLRDMWLTTWTTGQQDYDDHQWALLALLNASLAILLALGALIFVREGPRMVLCLAIFGYFWQDARADKETFPAQVFFGMFLCDLSMHKPTQAFLANRSWLRGSLSCSLILGGLYLASYPSDNAGWAGWSRGIASLEPYLFPIDSHLPKRFTAVGVDLLVLGIQLSTAAQRLLSNRLCLWLGKNSFAVYLVHGTLLRTLLVWLVYGVHTLPSADLEEGLYLPRAGATTFAFALSLWFTVVYSIAHVWTVHVDAFCARLTRDIERYLCREDH